MATPTRFFALLLCFSFLASACQKEEIDNSDKNYPIQLTATIPSRNVELTWTKTNIASFEGYVVVRSTEPIPDTETPPTGAIATISDQDINSFSDSSFPFVEKIYYKVFVKAAGRFLISPTVELVTNINLLNLAASFAQPDPENNVVFLTDLNKSQLYRYNYLTDEFTDSLTLSSLFTIKTALGDNGEGLELYISYNNDSRIYVYDAATLDFKTSIIMNGSVISFASGNNGFIYVATDNFNANFAVYKRSNKTLVGSANYSFGSFDRVLTVLPGNGLVIDAANSKLDAYTINQSTGAVTNHKEAFVQNNFFGSNGKITTSADGSAFMPFPDGVIYNKDLAATNSLPNPNFTFFSDFAFSEESDKLWAFPNSPFEMREFAYPSLDGPTTKPLNYSVVRAFPDGDQLILVGLVFNQFTTQTIVDRLPI